MKPFGDPLAPVRLLVRRLDRRNALMVLEEAGHESRMPDEGRSGYSRGELLVALGIAVVAALLTLLKISGSSPCLLPVYCL